MAIPRFLSSAEALSRRDFVLTGAAAPLAAAAVRRPNLLLIMTDQQAYRAWSGARNRWLRTPAIDSLAARGMSLSRAHCPYPVCSPSRSSIITGRMPHETGVMINGIPLPPGMPTLGEVFSKAGYQTVYGGKWHLPKSFDGMTGFERLIGGHALGSKMDTPLSEACSAWLRGRKAKEPFLLVASFMNPHDICQWIRDHRGASGRQIDSTRLPPAPPNLAADPNEPECIRFHRTQGYDLMSQAVGIAAQWQSEDVRLYLHDYYRMVESVDTEIGRVLAALAESGQERNTVVAFCSDHGEGMGAHRWVQKAAFWEDTVRVPLIFAGPGIPAGRTHNALTTLADLVPTFCGLAGIAPPPEMRGVSLLPVFAGKAPDREFVISELRYRDEGREGRMLRTGRHKYVVFNSGGHAEQMFDLKSDPGETHNLVNAGGPLQAHRDLLRRWLRETGDRFQPAFA